MRQFALKGKMGVANKHNESVKWYAIYMGNASHPSIFTIIFLIPAMKPILKTSILPFKKRKVDVSKCDN